MREPTRLWEIACVMMTSFSVTKILTYSITPSPGVYGVIITSVPPAASLSHFGQNKPFLLLFLEEPTSANTVAVY